jgi:hypothetical protein
MNLKLFVVASTLSLAALAAAGCQNTDSTPPTNTTTIIHDAPASSARTVAAADGAASAQGSNTNAGPGGATGASSTTADAINTTIVRNTQMTGSRVTAVVDSAGTATLNGFVQNAQQKALAEKAAKDTPGVSGLKDKLEIRPTGGAGKTDAASRVTSLTVGDPDTTTSSAAATPSPRVIVVNNYVPVPTQQQAPASPPSVNVTVNPPASGGGGSDNSRNNGGTNYTNDGNGSYPSSYDPSVYNGVTPENPAVMSSRLVPNYLRNMALSRDYEVSQYPIPYGYYGVRSAPNQFGGNGFPSSSGSNGGYPVYIPANGQ